jgi:hypothetical protein
MAGQKQPRHKSKKGRYHPPGNLPKGFAEHKSPKKGRYIKKITFEHMNFPTKVVL